MDLPLALTFVSPALPREAGEIADDGENCTQFKGLLPSHRIVVVGVGRDLCGSPSPTLLPKQGHLQQAVEDLVQAGLESRHLSWNRAGDPDEQYRNDSPNQTRSRGAARRARRWLRACSKGQRIGFLIVSWLEWKRDRHPRVSRSAEDEGGVRGSPEERIWSCTGPAWI